MSTKFQGNCADMDGPIMDALEEHRVIAATGIHLAEARKLNRLYHAEHPELDANPNTRDMRIYTEDGLWTCSCEPGAWISPEKHYVDMHIAENIVANLTDINAQCLTLDDQKYLDTAYQLGLLPL